MSSPGLTVVIPVHNGADVLGDQLAALEAQEYTGTWDVVVVDNRSTDASAALAREFASRLPIRVVDAPDLASAAYARNAGVAAASGEWIVFVDCDDVAAPGLLSAFAKHMDGYRILGGTLDDLELNDEVVAAWRYSMTQDGLPVALGRFPFVLTSNCAVRRDVFSEIGGFDPSLRYFGEDVDFSVRAHLAGIEIGWVPEAVVHYRHRDSLRALARQQFIYGRGSVVMFDRYRAFASPRRAVRTSVGQLGHLARGLPNLLRSRRRRGQWLSFAGVLAGQVVQSVRLRTWYVG